MLAETSRAAGAALVVGAAAFAAFWGLSTADVSLLRAGQLALHGVSIVALSIGLLLMIRAGDIRDRSLLLVGVVLSVAGLLTVLPVLFLGLVLVALWSMRSGQPLVGAALLVGAVCILSVFVAGGRPGYEEAPNPGALETAVTLAGIAGIAGGLMGLG